MLARSIVIDLQPQQCVTAARGLAAATLRAAAALLAGLAENLDPARPVKPMEPTEPAAGTAPADAHRTRERIGAALERAASQYQNLAKPPTR